MEIALTVFWWYCGISVVIGAFFAASIRYDRWRHDTGRDVTYSPNKDGLGYLIAAVIGCPVVNLLAVGLLVWTRYTDWRESEQYKPTAAPAVDEFRARRGK